MLQSKFLRTILLALVIVGGVWVLANRDRIQKPEDVLTLVKETANQWMGQFNSGQPTDVAPDIAGQTAIYPGEPGVASPTPPSQLASHPEASTETRQPSQPVQGVIRIGSFLLQPNVVQLQQHDALDLVADLCRQYDLMVLQNLDRGDTRWVKSIVDRMNRMGAVGAQHLSPLPNGNRSDYIAISDRQQRQGSTQTVMIFNRQTIELDQQRWYLVDDQAGAFKHDPMVAWFRARGIRRELAFSFSLAAVSISSHRPDLEVGKLGTLMRAIRNDGRAEDDVILVGDFQSDERGLDAIRNQAGLAWVVSRQPTNVDGDRQYDNIVFGQPATIEFTGRGGVVDYPRAYQLDPADAKVISDRLPVWAEFSVRESGNLDQAIPGRIAELPTPSQALPSNPHCP